MERELHREQHLMRYVESNDFGLPKMASPIRRFWLTDALLANVPQTYSMAGVLLPARKLSQS